MTQGCACGYERPLYGMNLHALFFLHKPRTAHGRKVNHPLHLTAESSHASQAPWAHSHPNASPTPNPSPQPPTADPCNSSGHRGRHHLHHCLHHTPTTTTTSRLIRPCDLAVHISSPSHGRPAIPIYRSTVCSLSPDECRARISHILQLAVTTSPQHEQQRQRHVRTFATRRCSGE
jgi:hypothetical protein